MVSFPPSAFRLPPFMATPIRQKRVAERLRAEISDLLQRELKDPRLGMVTVTRVTIDRELAHADVYMSTLGDAERRSEMLDALRSAVGFIRREVGRRVQLRNTPQLVFHWDPGMENVEHISRLLDELKENRPTTGEADDVDR